MSSAKHNFKELSDASCPPLLTPEARATFKCSRTFFNNECLHVSSTRLILLIADSSMPTLRQDGTGRNGRNNTPQERQAAVTGAVNKRRKRNQVINLAHTPATTRTTYSPVLGGKPNQNSTPTHGETVGTQMKMAQAKEIGMAVTEK